MGSHLFLEAQRKRQELLNYRFGDIHGQHYFEFSGLDIRDMREGGLRIGLFGPMGSGKSSFINTCERALKPELRKGTAEIQTGHGEGTIVLQEFLDDIDNGFRLVDTRGLFRHNIDEFKALADIIYGRIKPGQVVRFGTPADNRDTKECFSKWVHAIAIVLSATDPLLQDGHTHRDNLKILRDFMHRRVVTVITHHDRIDERQEEDILAKACAATGSARDHTFFVANYHLDKKETDYNTEIKAMDVIKSALKVGERYVKFYKLQEQSEKEDGAPRTLRMTGGWYLSGNMQERRHADHLKTPQQEEFSERKKLLKYRFGDKHGLRSFASLDIRDITADKVREAGERRARELREQAERERREIQEAERRDEERRRQQQLQEEQEKLREAQRLRKLQQESLGERKKLLNYCFGDKHGLRSFDSINIRDMQQSDRGIRIGMFGPSGSGKSSFINTCERALKLTTKGSCETQTSGAEGTILVQEYLDDIEGCQFCLVDTRGFFTFSVSEFLAMTNIVYGRIKPGEKIDLRARGEVQARNNDSWDTFPNWLHAVVIVLSARDPNLLKGNHTTNLNTIRAFMKPRGISPVCVVTHVDHVKDKSQMDQIKRKAAAATGSSPSYVYVIENYHPDHDKRDVNVELRAMEVINSALAMGERYVKSHKQQRQREEEARQAAVAQSIVLIEDFFNRLCHTKHIPHDKVESVIAALKDQDVATTSLLRDTWNDLKDELPISSRMETYIKDALFEDFP